MVIADGKLHIAFLNVGMGDCTLIQCPNGRRVLIDAGSSKWRSEGDLDADDPDLIVNEEIIDRDYYAAQLVNFLGGDPLDVLVLTHNDQDHYNMIERVLRGIQVGQIYHSNVFANYVNSSFVRWKATGMYAPAHVTQLTINATTPAPVVICDGTQAGGTSCVFSAIASDVSVGRSPRLDPHEKNTRSVVVRCAFGTNTFLFMGDATVETEAFLLAQYPPPDEAPDEGDPMDTDEENLLDVQFLRVGHHGSETSTSQDFLNAVQPQAAAISVSRLNGYGLPRTVVVDRLLDLGTLAPLNGHTIASYAGAGRRGVLPTEQDDCEVWLWETGWSGTWGFEFDGTADRTPW